MSPTETSWTAFSGNIRCESPGEGRKRKAWTDIAKQTRFLNTHTYKKKLAPLNGRCDRNKSATIKLTETKHENRSL